MLNKTIKEIKNQVLSLTLENHVLEGQLEILNPGLPGADFTPQERLEGMLTEAENLLETLSEEAGVDEDTESKFVPNNILLIRYYITVLEKLIRNNVTKQKLIVDLSVKVIKKTDNN